MEEKRGEGKKIPAIVIRGDLGFIEGGV